MSVRIVGYKSPFAAVGAGSAVAVGSKQPFTIDGQFGDRDAVVYRFQPHILQWFHQHLVSVDKSTHTVDP